MSIIQTISNSIKAAVGYQQSFDELLAAHDVTRGRCYDDLPLRQGGKLLARV